MPDGVAGKVVLILGGAGGIGAAAAAALAARGALIALADIDAARLNVVTAAIASQAAMVRSYEVDVRRREGTCALVDAVVREFGRLDILINSAGIMFVRPVTEVNTDEWEHTVDLNLKGTMWSVAAALPTFLAQRSGHIIALGSVHGLKVFPGGAVHAASKFAVRAFTDGIRAELAEHGVRVTTVMPGAVATGMESKTTGTAHETMRAIYATAIPPAAVADAICFAVDQPESVAVNELVLRPTTQQF
jgi:NADP-dependent 3-hydroxy acid dehydrogenase YdfG